MAPADFVAARTEFTRAVVVRSQAFADTAMSDRIDGLARQLLGRLNALESGAGVDAAELEELVASVEDALALSDYDLDDAGKDINAEVTDAAQRVLSCALACSLAR